MVKLVLSLTTIPLTKPVLMMVIPLTCALIQPPAPALAPQREARGTACTTRRTVCCLLHAVFRILPGFLGWQGQKKEAFAMSSDL